MPELTINGDSVDGDGEPFGVVDPATGEVFATAPRCSPDQLEAAMRGAERAFVTWRRDEGIRVAAMLKLAEVITSAADELTALLVSETGKPVPVAASEPGICAVWLQYYAGMAIPRTVLQDDAQARIDIAHRPLGVVAAITPWNFPLGLAMWKMAPALRAGNTVVLKPSPFTPLATLRLGEIMNEVLPPGVLNVVTGGDDLGAAMTAHPTPRKVSFTGSVAAGKKVAVAAAGDLKRVTLELGGNDAAILLDDADPAAVAPALVGVAFFNSGQACALPKRIFAPDAIYDEVVEAFAAVAAGMSAGMSDRPDRTFGPLSTRPQYERVRDLLAEARRSGARVASGGSIPAGGGFFVQPTILADVHDGQQIVDEEQFGPVLPILRYSNLDEAIRRANATTYGLCGSVWSRDEERALDAAEQLECGTTFVNTHAALLPTVPFGGSKWSGVGVENGVDGLLAFTEAQTVHMARSNATS
jgi:acyl-CoA reductase-like NAD-dependent aldehyde dehydrogenase